LPDAVIYVPSVSVLLRSSIKILHWCISCLRGVITTILASDCVCDLKEKLKNIRAVM
jgi:hypothetical protein